VPASVEIDALFNGVSRVDFSVVTTDRSLATIVKLFKLSTHIPPNYCLTPVTQPDGSGDWNVQHLSDVEMIVWKISADLSESGGGILLEVAGALSGAALPSEFSVGMQVRLDNIPTKFLVGVKNTAVAAAAAGVVAATGPAGVHHTISPGKPNVDTTVVRKAVGCVVEDLNGDPYTLRNKALSAERISRVGRALRECGAQRLDRLMFDLNFGVNEFKGECLRHSCRTDLPVADEMRTFSQLKSIAYLDVWSDDDMFTKCFIGLSDSLDWSVSLANFVKEDKCLWGDNFDDRGLGKLVEAAQNFARFMAIFKGAVYSDVFAGLVAEYNAQERRLEGYHVDYVWGMLEEVIRNYGHEVRHTRGKVSINYGIGQPIATPTDCANFFKFLLHEKLQALREGKWTQPPHTHYRCRVLALVRK